MTLDGILNNPEADRELRTRTKPKTQVTQEEHEKYVQERLFESGVKLGEIFSSIPEPKNNSNYVEVETCMDNFTSKAMEVIRSLSVVPSSKDISTFCKSEEFRGLEETDSVGMFVSFLINAFHKDEKPLVLDLRNAFLIDSFGYKLGKDVVVQGNLGDYPATLMEAGHLTVEGNCGENVGLYMKGGTIDVKGTIGHIGIIRYGGKIIHRGERMEPDDVPKQDLIELLRSHQHDYRLRRLYQELSSGEPAYLDPQLRETLHPVLLEPVCRHNLEIYARREEEYVSQLQRIITRAEKTEQQYWDKRWSKKGKFALKGIGATAITIAVPVLGLISIPYFLYQAKKTVGEVDRIVDEEISAAQNLEREAERISSLIDETHRTCIHDLEFYLGLPGVKNTELKRALETFKGELGIR